MSDVPGTEIEIKDPALRLRLKDYMMFLPRLVRLLGRLVMDPEVPARPKAVLVLTAGYLVFPLDVIPDFIPAIGHLDDVLVVAIALDQMLNRVPEHLIRKHWDGDEDVLAIAREILDISMGFVPGWAKRFVAR